MTSEVASGAVWAVEIAKTGAPPAAAGVALKPINHQLTNGADPCHLSIDATGAWLLAANYSGGSIAMFPILEDGALGALSDFVQHAGHSLNPQRQNKAHAHSITVDASNRFAIVADLGMDQVLVYALDLQRGRFEFHSAARVEPGAGPRHVAFHPGQRWLYVGNELGNTVTQLAWNATEGELQPLQSWPSLPATFDQTSYIADIHVAPNGAWLAASNRGHHSLALYSVDGTTGALTPRGHMATGGEWPRNFAIHPTGAWVLAANERSDNVRVFSASPDGMLAATSGGITIPKPVCMLFG